MTHLTRLSVLLLFFGTACTSPKLLLENNRDNLRGARTIATAFYESYGQQVGLKAVPFVTVGTEGGSGFNYDAAHNVLFITPYDFADFDTQKFFGKASEDSDGRAEYNAILFDYFTAHQMMHLVYDEIGLNAASHWEEELHINAMTWLFLKRTGLLQGRDATWLNTLSQVETRLVSRYPDAAPNANFAQALEVTNNATYWYVTAVSMRESYNRTLAHATEKSYISDLVLPPAAAQASVTR